jgi:DNA (cytosine-5)-methyltransferase 1
MTLTVGSLFSGIGGIDLGLERAGMNVIWQSEIDPFACKVLKKHWPEVPNHGDIKEIKWHEIERPDVICGGYPCQPFSTAGKRRGNQDPRHLWPWVRYAISQLRPRYAIMENVRGHLSMGGTDVLGDLAGIGYDAEWRVISAASVGANHKRDRIFIVAYPIAERLETKRPELSTPRFIRDREDTRQFMADPESKLGNGFDDYARDSSRPETVSELRDSSRAENVADTYNARSGTPSGGTNRNRATLEQKWGDQSQSWASRHSAEMANADSGRGKKCVFNDECIQQLAHVSWSIAANWETEPDVGRVAHGIPDRVDRLKGLGNAVVPQVAEIVGRLVMEAAGQ